MVVGDQVVAVDGQKLRDEEAQPSSRRLSVDAGDATFETAMERAKDTGGGLVRFLLRRPGAAPLSLAAQAAQAYERTLQKEEPDFFKTNDDTLESGRMNTWTPSAWEQTSGRTTRDLFPGVDGFQDYAERITSDLEETLGTRPQEMGEDGNPGDPGAKKTGKGKGKKNKRK